MSNNDATREQYCVCMDAMREEERVRMAQNAIIISSDDESDSGRRQIPSKLVTSFNKASTFPAKHNYDKEETLLKSIFLLRNISRVEIPISTVRVIIFRVFM